VSLTGVQSTHVVHPRSQYLTHYRTPIPWSAAVFSPYGRPAAYSYVLAIASSAEGKGAIRRNVRVGMGDAAASSEAR
jgi:hypothetical protein